MEEFLKVIISNLVENRDQVEITKKEEEKQTIFEVRVAKEDMGKVIGRQGRLAKSIRTVMKSVAAKEHKKVLVEFIDD